MRLVRVWLVLLLALTSIACGDEPQPVAPTPAPAAFVRMDIEAPAPAAIAQPGGTVQLRAVASFSDGTRPDVTNEAVWSVVDPRVLTVSRGVVTGVAMGGTIVTATYRGWSSVANVSVGPNGGRPTFSLTGVVRDAESGSPLAGAQFRQEHSHGTSVLAISDDNGFVNLGEMTGQFLAIVKRFGYEDSAVSLPSVREPTVLDVRLRPNGPFVERTATGTFEPPPPSYEESRTTLRLNTRAGGVFDAVLRSSRCAPETAVRVWADSGGSSFGSEWEPPCGARIRFVVPASDVLLTLVGVRATDWQLTYREPR